MVVKLIKNFQPQIVAIEHGPEPTIYEMMLHYYLTHGMSHKGASDCVKEYIDAIEAIEFR